MVGLSLVISLYVAMYARAKLGWLFAEQSYSATVSTEIFTYGDED